MKNATIYFLFFVVFQFNGQVIDSIQVADNSSTTQGIDDLTTSTFHSTRMINAHSIESLEKGVLEFRIEHRFGDIAGSEGGAQTLFGIDNAADIRFALEYGITDRIMIGLGRSKGTGAPYKSLIDGFVKYKILQQKKGSMPFSLSLLGTSTFSYMEKSIDPTQVSYFPKNIHRFAYASQLNLARKFGERFSLALVPSLIHRNYVNQNDLNTMFALGGGARIGLSSTMAILFEYFHCFYPSNKRSDTHNSLSVAFEWITFGHNFTIMLTNSKGIGETQFIPYTFENWADGQFRLGFCISRKFVKG